MANTRTNRYLLILVNVRQINEQHDGRALTHCRKRSIQARNKVHESFTMNQNINGRRLGGGVRSGNDKELILTRNVGTTLILRLAWHGGMCVVDTLVWGWQATGNYKMNYQKFCFCKTRKRYAQQKRKKESWTNTYVLKYCSAKGCLRSQVKVCQDYQLATMSRARTRIHTRLHCVLPPRVWRRSPVLRTWTHRVTPTTWANLVCRHVLDIHHMDMYYT